ncbi:MAG: hypothetical protein AB7S61_11415 [Methanoregulaceae archaeon]
MSSPRIILPFQLRADIVSKNPPAGAGDPVPDPPDRHSAALRCPSQAG